MQPGRGVRLPLPFDREKREKRRLRRLFSLLRFDKPLPCVQSFLLTGGARGGEARLASEQMPRNAVLCKACVERSEYFRAAKRHENTGIIAVCREKPAAFSTDWREKRRLRRLFSLLAATQIIGRTRTAAAPSSRCPTGSPAPRRSISAAAPSAPLPPPVPLRRSRRKTRQ